MLTRREFLGTCGALVGAGVLGTIGCSDEHVYEVTVSALDDGKSVYQATARYHRLAIDTRTDWNGVPAGNRKVVAIDQAVSDNWIFEINGRRYDGNVDAADLTHVRAGEIITWREV